MSMSYNEDDLDESYDRGFNEGLEEGRSEKAEDAEEYRGLLEDLVDALEDVPSYKWMSVWKKAKRHLTGEPEPIHPREIRATERES